MQVNLPRAQMKSHPTIITDIDQYIAVFPDEIRELLQRVRITIKKAAPEAEEAIKYRMPTFTLKGNLVHFAAFKNHIGFYPTSSGVTNFQKELSSYPTSKGAVQFPYSQSVPFELIAKIVKFRVRENLQRAEEKQKNR